MTTEQTAQQLELAAQLLRTGHPWEWETLDGTWFESEQSQKPEIEVCTGHKIRPILATPPDNRPLHNPQNLTAEQVGVGYRLLLSDETLIEGYQYWLDRWHNGFSIGEKVPDYNANITCRLPLSVPWSEPDDTSATKPPRKWVIHKHP